MRKYLYAVTLSGAALALAIPAAQAHTATPRTATHVLTISKLRGTAVKKGAVLKANLARGTTVTVSLSGNKATCKKASFALKVVTNPVAKGKATLSVTSEKISRCKISFAGATVKSITAKNLPYGATVSDAKGDPVTISGTSTSAPIQFAATITLGPSTFTCKFDAATSTGHASNTHHVVTFKNQKFTSDSSNTGPCTALTGPALFTASFGPIRDTSVSNSPIVFVN